MAQENLKDILAEIQKRLGLSSLNAQEEDKTFFEMGMSSLTALELTNILNRRLGEVKNLDVSQIFDYNTPAKLIGYVSGLIAQEKQEPVVLQPINRNGFLPLSFGQERFWFIQQLEPLSTYYNLSISIIIEGEFDRKAFARAFERLNCSTRNIS